MADISIVKIKVRRGTDSDRNRVILDEGELGFTTDNKRLFVGDGNTLGGVSIANKFLGRGLRGSFGTALIGDTVYDVLQNNMFGLTATPPSLSANWANLGPQTDDVTLQYRGTPNKLSIIDHAITRVQLNAADIVYSGLSATGDSQILLDLDQNTLKFNANKVYVDTAVIPVSGLKSTPLGLATGGLKLDGLYVVPGGAALATDPTYISLPSKSLFILNEPSLSNFYYLMIKTP
jgi:hypothetical protein